jgi:lipid II:glycine glycyltransferase (peptidoglycan interpeptide bridge formation enzyme)
LIKSWLTGARLVSAPFSDHCQPLADNENLKVLLAAAEDDLKKENWEYIELRTLLTNNSTLGAQETFMKSTAFWLHKIDLRPELQTLVLRFHKNSVRQMIRRAEREGLLYEQGRSELLLKKFYHLLLLTRRRHQLPPQPLHWFQSLVECLDEKLNIHLASKDGRPVASILTLLFKNTLIYKYACSDDKYHSLGGMPFLLWKAIEEGKGKGATEFDLGRSEFDNPGLIAFKDHFGAARSTLNYYRYPPGKPVYTEANGNKDKNWKRLVRYSFARVPAPMAVAAGKLLYKHVG